MTEQEAEAMAARLTRIWGAPPQELYWEPESESCSKGYFGFVTYIAQEATLIYSILEGKANASLEAKRDYLELDCRNGGIWAVHTNPSDEMEYASSEALRQFADEWLPFFRRGCWLSGCLIEATAHEKMEWMQVFTREELEAWNLKF